MHEITYTLGTAPIDAPNSVKWQTIPVSRDRQEFKDVYDILLNATNRNLYFLLQTYDAKIGWVNSADGENITGALLSASYNYSNDSDITRTFSFSFYADGTEDLFISPVTICKFFVGVNTNLNSDEIMYFSLGCGMIDSPSWRFDAETRNVSFNAIDLMCILDGSRTGVMSYEYIWKFDQDSTVKTNIIGIIENTIRNELGYKVEYTDQSISSCVDTEGNTIAVQNDIEASAGTTVKDMLSDII